MTVFDFQAVSIGGENVALSTYRGELLLIVNVASRCGFTPQYEGLERLYRQYKDKGFSILGFPCNQFRNQEPGSEQDIQTFCATNFGVSFPMFSKIEVNGPGTHPLYKFLKESKPGLLGTRRIKWNFTKFLVDRQGVPVRRYAPQHAPDRLAADIAKLV